MDYKTGFLIGALVIFSEVVYVGLGLVGLVPLR